MAIGLAVSHGDVMMGYGKPLAQFGKTPLVFCTIVSANPLGFPPSGYDIVQELCGSPTVQRWDRYGLYPLGERIYCHKQVLVSHGVFRKRAS